jgi:two-component system sensor histidine kinase/response regulator
VKDADKTRESLIEELQEIRRLLSKLRKREVSGQARNMRDGSNVYDIAADFLQDNKVEDNLKQSIDTIEALLNATRDMVYLVDNKGTIIVANHRGVEFLGGSHHRLICSPIFDFLPPKLAAERREKLDEVVRSGSPLVFEDKHYVRHFENTLYPILGQQGIERIAIYSRDITNSKRAERALKESKEKYKHLIEMMNEGLWIQDEDGIISYVNGRLCEMLGYSSNEMIGHRVADFLDKPNLEKLQNRMEKRERQGAHACEIEWRCKDERRVWTIVAPSLLYDADGAFLGSFAVITDITDRKSAEEELRKHRDHLEELVKERTAALIVAREQAEQASRAKSEFLANMSHEIRTPINGIIGMTQLALNTHLTAEQAEYLEAVDTSADALLRLINDILDFSKMEAGKLELISIDFGLRDSIAESMTTLAVQAHTKGLELLYHVPSNVPDALIGDPGRLRQVLLNLVANAIKFTERGEVAVKVELESETDNEIRLHFSIADTGIGVPTEKQKKIFSAFEQADGSTSRKYGGTGLGLAISSELVRLMGGRIWLESEVGKGSIFHFTVSFALQRQVVPLPVFQDLSVLRDLPVLVVDDNATNRRILEETLLQWQMKPTIVDSGAAALSAMKSAHDEGRPFSLVMTDSMMPEMDGFGLVEQINEHPCWAAPTIIMLTSAGERGDAARCMKLGIAAYLLKPIKQSELLFSITRMLRDPLPAPSRPSLITRHSIRESAQRLQILLAEDNIVNQKLAVRMLEKMGHTVWVAANGREALDILERQKFDLILMDVQMPIMDGLEATRAVREREMTSGEHAPIVAMTAYAMKGDKEKCLDAGMDGYVSKPIDAAELFETIEDLFLKKNSDTIPRSGHELTKQPLSKTQILDRVGGDETLLKELVDLFIADYPRRVSDIQTAIREGDAQELEQAAHALKGSIGNFTSESAFQAALRLETIGRDRDMAQAPDAMIDLENKVRQLQEQLVSLVEEIERRES